MSDTVVAPPPVAPTPTVAPSIIVAALCFGGAGVALTQTLVIPVQSSLPGFLHTSAANASWVVTATLLGAAIAMPISGRLGDIVGKQRVLMASAGLLLAGSVISALSHSLAPMLAGRLLQGLSMGFIPVGISFIRAVVPPDFAATGISAMSATLGVGGALGLPLAAWIADAHDWHVLFWLAAAVAVVMLVVLWFVVPHTPDRHPGSFDYAGAVGLAVGLVLTLVGISKGNEWGWESPRTLGCLVAGTIVLIAWGWFELHQETPLCDLRLAGQRSVLITNVAAITMGLGMMAQSIVVPQLLQMPHGTGYGLDKSILAAGLWMAPSGLMMLAFAPVSSRLLRTVGARNTLAIGAIVLGCGYLVSFFMMSTPWQLLIASMICTSGVGIGYAAMPTLIMNAVPLTEAGSAVGFNGLMRSIGTTSAAAAMTAILTGQTQVFEGASVPTEGAFRLCFLVGALAAFAAAATTTALRSDRPR